jgi:hypothetical protein
LADDERTRELLREALLEGLRTNFAVYRRESGEIEKLLEEPAQRATYSRLMAAGLQEAGQWREAFDQYVSLMDVAADDHRMEVVERSLLVRRDRWVQAALASLCRDAKGAAAVEIDEAVQKRLKAALADKTSAGLRRFLDYFDGHPAATAARRELIDRAVAEKRSLEAELLLWRDRQSPDRAVAGHAVARMAEMFEQAKCLAAAAACYRQLGGEFAHVVCRDGKTGKQLADALPKDNPVAALLKPEADWPVGLVEAAKKTTVNNSQDQFNPYGRFGVQYDGDPKPFFSGLTLRFDQQPGRLIIYDAYGVERRYVPLTDARQQNNFYPYNPNMTNAYVAGHLLVLPVGTKIYGLDPAGLAGGDGKPGQLWSQDLTDLNADCATSSTARGQAGAQPLGLPPFAFNQFQFRMNPVGAMTSRYVCFQRMRNIVAVDPLNGEPFWVRHDIPPGSELFGDDDYIFVLPADAAGAPANPFEVGQAAPNGGGDAEALVLSARDGRLLGKRSVPRVNYRDENAAAFMMRGFAGAMPTPAPLGDVCLASLGRKLLTWKHGGKDKTLLNMFNPWDRGKGKATLAMFDPWEQRTLWKTQAFHSNSRVAVVGEEAVGVVEPDGHFMLFELPGGRVIADVKLETEEALVQLYVVHSGNEYLVLTQNNKPSKRDPNRPIQALPGGSSCFIPQGRIYALDERGKLLWPGPVTIEDQYFLLNQPERLPVITFACQRYDQRANGQWWPKTRILCLDKRTGRVVYRPREGTSRQNIGLEVVGDPKKKTVELQIIAMDQSPRQVDTVTLTFTDKPIPEAAADKDAAGEKAKHTKLGDALLDSLDKSIDGVMP